jgi:mono/diheme cytochrome c family protein
MHQRSPRPARALALGAALLLGACKDVTTERYDQPAGDPARGKALAEVTGCGACHTISGIGWPKGRTAIALAEYDDVGLIAGAVPNTPANLAAFVRNAPAVKPGSTMPPTPVTHSEARDIAAFLYSLEQG